MIRKILFLLLISAYAYGAAPTFTSTTGTLSNGNTITIAGSNFGTVAAPTQYDYFDKSSNWSCNADDGSCTNPGQGAGSNITWYKMIFDGESAQMQVTGHALFNINQDDTNYSTGRAWNEWFERNVAAEGLPNGSAYFNFPSPSTEIFLVFYTKVASNWPSFAPIQDKMMTIWTSADSSGDKITGWWGEDWYGHTRYYVTSDVGGDADTFYENTGPLWSTYGGLGKWVELKIHIKRGASPILDVYLNGTRVWNLTPTMSGATSMASIRIRSNFTAGPPLDEIPVGQEFLYTYDDIMLNTNGTDPTGGHFPGIACVYISDQATWGTGPTDSLNGDSHFVRQKIGGTSAGTDQGYLSWSNTGFKFTYNEGSLSGTKYLYVTNWAGETNSTGYDLSGGEDSTSGIQGVTISGVGNIQGI